MALTKRERRVKALQHLYKTDEAAAVVLEYFSALDPIQLAPKIEENPISRIVHTLKGLTKVQILSVMNRLYRDDEAAPVVLEYFPGWRRSDLKEKYKNSIITTLHRLCKQDDAVVRVLEHFFAADPNENALKTEVEPLTRRLKNLTRGAIIHTLKELDDIGVGSFKAGRHGTRSRFIWYVNPIEVGKTAKAGAKDQDLDILLPPRAFGAGATMPAEFSGGADQRNSGLAGRPMVTGKPGKGASIHIPITEPLTSEQIERLNEAVTKAVTSALNPSAAA